MNDAMGPLVDIEWTQSILGLTTLPVSLPSLQKRPVFQSLVRYMYRQPSVDCFSKCACLPRLCGFLFPPINLLPSFWLADNVPSTYCLHPALNYSVLPSVLNLPIFSAKLIVPLTAPTSGFQYFHDAVSPSMYLPAGSFRPDHPPNR